MIIVNSFDITFFFNVTFIVIGGMLIKLKIVFE